MSPIVELPYDEPMTTTAPDETAIDLHTHTRASDGTDAPAELVTLALEAGLDWIGLTDHDTTAGWAEAIAAARRTGLGLVPGMELSTRLEGCSVHLLAYLIDPDDRALTETTAELRDVREHRARRIVDALARDFPITWDDVLAQSADARTVGRPHIADALVAAGIVPDRSTAFQRMLHPRAGYVLPYHAPDTLQAVGLVRDAGGVPVIAHPGAYRHGTLLTDALLRRLVDAGLVGMEVDHRLDPPALRRTLRAQAAALKLVTTGSSDYHGTGKPNRLGEFRTSPEALERILAIGTGSVPVRPAGR